MKKIRVGLLFGGPSAEHDVSISSAKQIRKYLNKDRYQVIPIKISRSGVWPKGYSIDKLKSKIDLAFIAIHGSYGEDGTIQAILSSQNIPFTGSGVLASALAMDKFLSGQLAQIKKLNVPHTILASEYNGQKLAKKVVIKPNNSGSSLNVHIIPVAQLRTKLKNLTQKDRLNTLIQEYISGREVTVGVTGTHIPNTLPVIEIIPKAKMYDYNSKYQLGGSDHIVPANLPSSISRQLQIAAATMHVTLGCKGMSRSDFIVKGKKIYYLETNTIPGMTATSLLPQAAEAAGITFPKLLDFLIQDAQA